MAAAIDNYRQALAYIQHYPAYTPDQTGNWSLERLRGLLVRLGSPEKKFLSLLIAGTKGKGSTAAISESILRSARYQTGLYTSPYLHSFRESIRLGGEPITETEFLNILRELRPYFETTAGLTAFELTTALALFTFAQLGVDIAVLEVGLGGRLDATNVVAPTVAVITPISYDHIQVLGPTLTAIATEKTGIIRDGALVISAPQVDEARGVIERVCSDRQAKLILVDRDWQWQPGRSALDGQTFTIGDQLYHLPLLGRHQITNAVTALAALAGLRERAGVQISNQAIADGLASVTWPGRLELLQQRPYVILDSAMNGDSAEKLAGALAHYFGHRPITFIFGASHDHAVVDMLKVLLPLSERMIMTASAHRRAELPEHLVAMAGELGYTVDSASDPALALDQALAAATEDTLICVAGSLFLVAEVRETWLRRNGLPLPPLDPKDLY
ncbi:MAG: bifunctional folylpolyglutamate synthase/dihydrofolate synthase [Anaerolineaceae bacterium]|nr:bifunctional folylpolyglutamate synthase/dihydrofolate synthase [Anaerolineaceae bacterium]